MDLAPALYMIRVNGHPGATVLSAFPAMAPHHHGTHTVLIGLLDRSALYGVLAEIEALGPGRWDGRRNRRLSADSHGRAALTACPGLMRAAESGAHPGMSVRRPGPEG
jgi:hypothetical protein